MLELCAELNPACTLCLQQHTLLMGTILASHCPRLAWCADLQPPAAAQHCLPQTDDVTEGSRLQAGSAQRQCCTPTPILSHCEVLGGTAPTQGCTEHWSKYKASVESLTRDGLGPAAC